MVLNRIKHPQVRATSRSINNAAIIKFGSYERSIPRDAMHSADYAVARCLSVRSSVCLSHTGIMLKRFNISSNFFPPPSSHTILVFPYQTWWGMKNRDFRQKSRYISQKQYKIRPWLLWNANMKPYQSFRMVQFSTTLSDLEWLTEYLMTRSIVRSLCDSWAFRFVLGLV